MPGSSKLVGVELGVGLGDPLALLVQQFGQQFRFRLTALGKLDFDFRQAVPSAIRSNAGTRSAMSRSTSVWMRATAIFGAARA